jgi:hypothetical protein
MLLIVSKTFKHPRMLSGFIRIANIVDTISSLNKPWASEDAWIHKSSFGISDAFSYRDTVL